LSLFFVVGVIVVFCGWSYCCLLWLELLLSFVVVVIVVLIDKLLDGVFCCIVKLIIRFTWPPFEQLFSFNQIRIITSLDYDIVPSLYIHQILYFLIQNHGIFQCIYHVAWLSVLSILNSYTSILFLPIFKYLV